MGNKSEKLKQSYLDTVFDNNINIYPELEIHKRKFEKFIQKIRNNIF